MHVCVRMQWGCVCTQCCVNSTAAFVYLEGFHSSWYLTVVCHWVSTESHGGSNDITEYHNSVTRGIMHTNVTKEEPCLSWVAAFTLTCLKTGARSHNFNASMIAFTLARWNTTRPCASDVACSEGPIMEPNIAFLECLPLHVLPDKTGNVFLADTHPRLSSIYFSVI